ncbi:sulfotransferase family 2 domain-containing protein [Halomonas sp. PA16-9]|uniref:sulfotransferase family 2 domain-containing protein n=1 Tax=Halomonas sp. PA16-9 TaxID=2576841 RepID=UPI0012DA2128|nr:sulfotransferase family protein [Halomonas sp. PA16-9]
MSPLYFVHIPKTAGTSFRKACEDYFGEKEVVYDYYPDIEETSSLIKESIYRNDDFFGFDVRFHLERKKFLSGHVAANKYVCLFGVANTVAFFRDPVQRIVSEYNHFVRHNNYQKDLNTFYHLKHAINRQSRMMTQVPLEALGFIGLTETYNQSLLEINDRYGLKIKQVQLNQGRSSQDIGYDLDDETLSEIRNLNEDDIRLYHRAEALAQQRTQLFEEGKPYTHAALQDSKPGMVRGWAWYADTEEPVEVAIYVNGHEEARVFAKDIRPGMLQLSMPRKGYVGFHHKFSKPLEANDNVECRVASTGQVIGRYTV